MVDIIVSSLALGEQFVCLTPGPATWVLVWRRNRPGTVSMEREEVGVPTAHGPPPGEGAWDVNGERHSQALTAPGAWPHWGVWEGPGVPSLSHSTSGLAGPASPGRSMPGSLRVLRGLRLYDVGFNRVMVRNHHHRLPLRR